MIEPSAETIPSGPARCPAASSTKTADESGSHCTRPLARSSGIRRSILPSMDSKTRAFVGPPLPPWDLEMSVVPSGERSGKSPDALSSRAALVDVIAVDDVGVASVSSGDGGALVLGCGLGELVPLAQPDARATANRQAARRMS